MPTPIPIDTPIDQPQVQIVDDPEVDYEADFVRIETELWELERKLRRREVGSTMCQPMHRIRWALGQLKKYYLAGQTVCDKHTKLDDYLAQNKS